ncbi:hypothetical protein CROQUDRAFT_38467 [Cronartium quercuum f. sp. fusiforme G11]|uniref:Rho-GAP domain-containing protein n=1 Tax=Cronartium quercuum f. sp. fusiforme G11 TaxID=708437 RepID=A0A9P6TG24_9BASI|nr:hypothetical protein CROQUDRAFT_38467 [Cronartium quercuum f. sp. fusiforme G11]
MRSSFLKGRHLASNSLSANPPQPTVFGARLEDSLELASVAISMIGQDKKAYIYGYIPVVVAKCGLFLKENGTSVQGIFRISGSTKRMRELQTIFDDPPNYGKDLDWKTTNPLDYGSSSTSSSTGSLTLAESAAQKSYFSVHDAANVLRRYLMSLPEPLIPYTMYEDFRNVLRDYPKEKPKQVRLFKSLICTLPPSSQYLLLYLLDLLSVFAQKSDVNLMTSANLAVVFQPGLCSPPPRNKAMLNRIIHHHQLPKGSSTVQQDSLDEQNSIMREVKEAQEVLQFLIDNQNYFVLALRPQPKPAGTLHPAQQYQPVSRTVSLQ